jgi:hypothetical protein
VLGLEIDAKTFVRAENALMLQPAQAWPVLALNCDVMSGLAALNYPSHSHRLFERRGGSKKMPPVPSRLIDITR